MRSSIIDIRVLDDPDERVRVSLPASAGRMMPTKCGNSFWVQYSQWHGGEPIRGGVLQYSGHAAHPWNQLASWRWTGSASAHQIDCDGAFALMKLFDVHRMWRYGLFLISPTGRTLLVEKQQVHQLGDAYPVGQIGSDGQRAAVYSPRDGTLDIADVRERRVTRTYDTDFEDNEPEHATNVAFAGLQSRYCLLANTNPALKSNITSEDQPSRILVVDLGEEQNPEADKYTDD